MLPVWLKRVKVETVSVIVSIKDGGPGGTRTPGAVRHRVYSATELPLSDRPTNLFYQ